ncbi:MAG: thioredoxin family protein [bacterium]
MNDIMAVSPEDQSYIQHEWAVLLFESPWCGSCKELLRSMEKLSLPEGVDCFLGTVDISQHQSMAIQYNVMSLPTVIIFQKGIPQERFSGKLSEEKFFQKVKRCIENVT